LNADALRLCTEENVLSNEQITVFLNQKKELFQQRLSEMLQGITIKGASDRNAFTNSLAWDGDISAMDGIVPVVVSNSANEVYAVGFNLSLFPAELTITPQQFLLQGVANQSVTYRIIFPRGITVNASDNRGNSIITGKTKDGLDYVELSFDADAEGYTTVLSCSLAASPVYVLGIFLPCILVFILVIILIVVIWLVRKKRKRGGGGKRVKSEETEPIEYSDEEYYVPPPPPSSKKK
jgi:hypothetical protein